MGSGAKAKDFVGFDLLVPPCTVEQQQVEYGFVPHLLDRVIQKYCGMGFHGGFTMCSTSMFEADDTGENVELEEMVQLCGFLPQSLLDEMHSASSDGAGTSD